MDISLIWAMANNGVIGRGNQLPWRLPKDVNFFKQATLGKPVIMGRKTFESMKSPLPGRTNIVLTSMLDYVDRVPTGVVVVNNFAAALKAADAQARKDGRDELMIAGGAAVYRLGLAVATRLYVTRVAAEFDGDTLFPEVTWTQWQEERCEHFAADEKHAYPFSISVYTRRGLDQCT
jgi:dihydrofolate reductase